MFIKLASGKRVNLEGILEYEPIEKLSIKISYVDGKTKDLLFKEEEQRNEFLSILDKNLLKSILKS